jgi:hypothetical protein
MSHRRIGLFSKHVLQKLLFTEDANYLIICGSKVMDVLSIIGVVVFSVTVAPAEFHSAVRYVHKYSSPLRFFVT